MWSMHITLHIHERIVYTHTHSIPSILDGSNLKLTIHLVPNLGANKHYNINNNVISVIKHVPV